MRQSQMVGWLLRGFAFGFAHRIARRIPLVAGAAL